MSRPTAFVVVALGVAVWACGGFGTAQKPQFDTEKDYATAVRPLVAKYCLGCHSAKLKKGSLDLERFATANDVRRDLKVWQQVIEQLEAGEMPPANRPQPTAEERKTLIAWARTVLDAEARARAGDPGHVPLRRLSNAEYDYTIRDLTGVDLRPTREFPADGAAGEGFTNAAEALTDISPALLTKYLNAAKDVSERTVLLPDGFRFSLSKTRRDWTDESTARLRQFYSQFAVDGRLPIQLYLAATVRHREKLVNGTIALDEVARTETLNRKYLGVLWTALTDTTASQPLAAIRAKWRQASEKDVPALAAEVAVWQSVLWRVVPIGSYRHGDSSRQVPNDPAAAAIPNSAAYRELVRGHDEFRACFPKFLCFPHVIPTDEVVSLKMFHREDEPLIRLFLDDEQTRRIEHLWNEHRFVSRQPVAENDYLPQFIGYVTQDQPKELLAYFESQRPVFQKRADEFEKDAEVAIPRQLDALLEFASRAYRRPLADKEKVDLLALYRTLREKGAAHEEAFRGVLSRVLVAPAFLFRIEHAPPGKDAGPVSDWELATRLSYFLWASLPDGELRDLAASGKLRDPAVLAAQTRRLVKDDRVRGLAVEFGTQWIHVRGFDDFNEKNEKLFPTFTPELRRAMNEEGILFFQDLFQCDRAVSQILDADHTFLNELLAKHYAIPGVSGPQWRRVDGVKAHGRGGILGFGSVQAKHAGASRTSPVLRGNWVVETLLGEKLPRPPANVPQLPEAEGTDALTIRQQVEKHAKAPECAICHVRIDPYGFALEKYDSIGRRREADLGGLRIDSRAALKDGATFDDLDGLRTHLLTKKKDVFVRLFCRKLLGYALGRSVTLSDTALLDEMVAALNARDGHLTAALLAIVRSPQFRMVRGVDSRD